MSGAVKIERSTIEDYYALPEGTSAELIHGIIYDMSPAPMTVHQRLSMRLSNLIYNHINFKGGKCEVFTAPFDVKLSEDTVVQPDISVICDKSKITERGCDGAPDLVIEIVSNNAAHDYIRKLNIYHEYGVREYWIVDPKRETVSVYIFDEDFAVMQYSFSDSVPVGIYDGELTINVSELLEQ